MSSVHSVPLVDFASSDLQGFRQKLDAFKSFLVNLESTPFFRKSKMTNTDLLTVRDEILANINQFLYLSTFSK
jgi:hypothetical protein